MFVQVIEGRLGDREGLLRQLDRWLQELAPGTRGWLGTTAGVADDGTAMAVVRFESEQVARASSERPEQGAWWEATEGCFDGDVTFRDCLDVDTLGPGGSDDAGFVQIMQGRGDRERLRAEVSGVEEALRRMRPDVLGSTVAWSGDGTFTQVVYFTSEAEARQAEQAEPSPEDAAVMAKLGELLQVDRYVDLREPLLHSPG